MVSKDSRDYLETTGYSLLFHLEKSASVLVEEHALLLTPVAHTKKNSPHRYR